MVSRRVFAAWIAAAVVGTAAVAALHAQSKRRVLYVSVVDHDGNPVPNLGPGDFIVREDNVGREVLTVEPATAPVQVALLVDNSSAAAPFIGDLRTGVEAFVTAMTEPTASGAHNELAIIGMADRPTILADYSIQRDQLMKGVGRIFAQPDSGTTFIDSVFDACKGLLKRGGARPAIVAVSTERVDLSNRMHDEAVNLLKQADVRFIALMIGPPADISRSLELREREMLIDQGTDATGGWRENLVSSIAVRPALQKLANQLTHEYLVTYGHPDTLIPPDKITVTMKRSGLTAHARVAQPEEGKRP